MIKRRLLYLVVWFLLTICGYSAEQPPAVKPSAKTTQIDSNTVRLLVHIVVPENHHAYVDSGESQLYIPISFQFPDLEKSGLQVKPTSKPKGDWYSKAKANVLRGDGDFEFVITRPQTAVQWPDKGAVLVGSQICNEKTDVCYRPQTSRVEFPLLSSVKK